jgi:aryl-alcohol dehydrogenase-like predicted oxidoreductase
VQNPYNFIWRFIEEDVLPYCLENGIAVNTYSSLAQGLLAGVIRLNTRFDGADIRPTSVLWKPENLGKCLYTVERLRAVAVRMGVSVAQLALRWLMDQPGVTTCLVGALTVAEIEENTRLFDWEFPEEIRREVQEISDELYWTMPYYYDMWENWSGRYKRGPQREVR